MVWGHFHPHDCTDIFTHGKNHVHVWKLLWNPDYKPEEPPRYGMNGNRRPARPHGKLLWDKKGGLFEVYGAPSEFPMTIRALRVYGVACVILLRKLL